MLIDALASLTISVYHPFLFPSGKSCFSQLSTRVLPLVLLALMVHLSSLNTHFSSALISQFWAPTHTVLFSSFFLSRSHLLLWLELFLSPGLPTFPPVFPSSYIFSFRFLLHIQLLLVFSFPCFNLSLHLILFILNAWIFLLLLPVFFFFLPVFHCYSLLRNLISILLHLCTFPLSPLLLSNFWLPQSFPFFLWPHLLLLSWLEP